ncbi:MAG: penicillin-binding protein 2, penicillin-binding protein 2, partial [Parcubacteria group bacterium GW2011_GWC1_38_6]
MLLDSLAKKKEEEMGTSARKFEIPLSRGAMSVFYYIVIVLLFFLLGKVFSMQIIEGDKFSRLADDNRSRSLLYQPIRGVIYDQNNVQLVFNESSFDLVLDKRDLPPEEDRRNTILSEVANIVGKEFNELKIETEKSTEPTLLISKNLSHDKLLILETKIGQKALPGFRIEKNIIRDYRDGNVFSHIVGYLGRIDEKE